MSKTKFIKINLIFLLTFTFIIYILSAPIFAFGPSSSKIYQGIDVSIYQGDIDFEKVKQSGIEVVYIKSSEGSNFIDPLFERNYEKAKRSNLKVGFYHYVTARTEEQAIRQAEFFVSTISGKVADCRLAMDFENFGNLSKEEINRIGLAFLKRVEELSKKEVVLYSDAFNANSTWSGEITKYPLWIAQYEVEEPENNGTWNSWVGWQYTDVGDIRGIEAYVDRDKYTKEIFLSDNSELPKPEIPEKPEKPEDPSKPERTKTITIKRGDTLSCLAIKYNTTVEELVKLNNIKNPNLIYAGKKLIVPNNQKDSANSETYTVKKGDTLSKIALIFNTTVNEIAKNNNIQNVNLIYPNQRLIIYNNNNFDTGHTLYKVQKGDSLWKIARRNNTTIANILRLNRIKNKNLIYPNQIFRI